MNPIHPRKPFIAGNWKMNMNVKESVSFVKSLKTKVKNIKDRDIVLCPSFVSLNAVNDILKKSNIKVGAQDVYFEDKGAFTSRVSALMLKGLCDYIIIGHSERRQYFHETDETVNKKIKKALEHNFKPIFCLGETLEQRENNITFDVIEEQLTKGLDGVKKIDNIIIAYEPVWAIGTGKNATPEQAEGVHVFIRKKIEEMYDLIAADKLRIIYGGSVKPDNIKSLMEKDNIDGCLVGGASLEVNSFSNIIKF